MSDEQILDLILGRTPFIDVRAPEEFFAGHVPGSVNLPLLDDEQRKVVGTTYKKRGQDAAIEVGLGFISGETRRSRIAGWKEFAGRHPGSVLYCFRGGLRSQSVRLALLEEGIELPLVDGGYKRVRQLLMNEIERISLERSFAVVSGYTGSGKTDLLAALPARIPHVDIEALAHHKGSAFGKWTVPQPQQADFENALAVALLRAERMGGGTQENPILVEDESRTIGRSVLPLTYFQSVSRAPIYFVERSAQERARYLIESYLLSNYGLAQGEKNEEKLAALRADLERNVRAIEKRLGGADMARMLAQIAEAMSAHERTGDASAHFEWVMWLLVRYYDPQYAHHFDRIKERVVFSGTWAEVFERLGGKIENGK